MPRTAKDPVSVPVDSLKHRDKRVNIPTEELRDFVAEDEREPKTLLYPRDPSLDPQLVWKGKDEQDAQDLAVPSVPIYIQEKIHPQAIVENVRAEAKKGRPQQTSLFADFNGIAFEEMVDFYRHEQNWTNRMILGDSLLVMASLAEKEGLKGKVQTIYIDPPYGIKFGSNWQVSTRKRDVRDGKAEDLTRQPEQVRAFRDTWKLGIHSYLAYLRDRLVVARELLTESGSVFMQIGDENVHLVRCVLDEVFGSECAVTTILVKKKGSQKSDLIDPVNDYLLWYSRTSRHDPHGGPKFRPMLEPRKLDEETLNEFRTVELPDGAQYPLGAVKIGGDIRDYRSLPAALFRDIPNARLFRPWPITNGGERANQNGPLAWGGVTHDPPKGRCWSHTIRTDDGSIPGMIRVAMAGRLIDSGSSWDYKRYLDDFPFKEIANWWDGLGGAADQVYVVQTNPEIIKRCILMTTDPGDLVLDPTCGSGTTAYVAEQWGRRWITCDTSRVALALARTRLMAAKYPYYLLADSPEGIKKEAEFSGKVPPEYRTGGDIKKGFIYKRAPRITSGSIANTPDIRGGMSRKEIDASIARHADTETLHDQPYEDNKRIRVAGPFTVESLSPHRVLSTDEERPASEREAQQTAATGQFETMILANLEKAGVQNTRKSERLKLDRLEPYAGTWLNAAGEYTDSEGIARRVAISLGPEHGTVGPEQVKEAAKEALRGIGFDLLVVCGFAFDAHAGETAREFSPEPQGKDGFVTEETRQYGRLPVMLARINPDLAMGDTLLKSTGAGNLFMVFGEPDIEMKRQQDGRLVLEIRGVDVYDPTTGQIRSNSTDDIACWFIDTDYNGESFFVRHAYFTGADEPYEKLKRALRAEIDEAAWSALYSTVSRPFDPPQSGKIAVKVINHYGDEVLKVFAV
ncbi:MAG: site-specific DNA-methyltransferase [Chloroflexi bacterium]|nr:site-specific DNA-methyltransferase [Chloroflexota bacterium]